MRPESQTDQVERFVDEYFRANFALKKANFLGQFKEQFPEMFKSDERRRKFRQAVFLTLVGLSIFAAFFIGVGQGEKGAKQTLGELERQLVDEKIEAQSQIEYLFEQTSRLEHDTSLLHKENLALQQQIQKKMLIISTIKDELVSVGQQFYGLNESLLELGNRLDSLTTFSSDEAMRPL